MGKLRYRQNPLPLTKALQNISSDVESSVKEGIRHIEKHRKDPEYKPINIKRLHKDISQILYMVQSLPDIEEERDVILELQQKVSLHLLCVQGILRQYEGRHIKDHTNVIQQELRSVLGIIQRLPDIEGEEE